MNSLDIKDAYNKRKNCYFRYIDNVKKTMPIDIYSIINTVIVKNPFNHNFPLKFLVKDFSKRNKYRLFFQITFVFYIKQFKNFMLYFITWVIFKVFNTHTKESSNHIGIDIPFFVDKVIKKGEFIEDYYFIDLYSILKRHGIKFSYILRLYGLSINPFKIIKLLNLLKNSKDEFVFEFELLTFKDLLLLFNIVLKYPFKTLRLLQKEYTEEDVLFNSELILNISNIGLEPFSRYIFGKNISLKKEFTKIYSWSEFQAIERSFNYAIRINKSNTKLIGCQLFLNYDTYFNSIVDDLDFMQKTAYDRILVNGKKYLSNRKYIEYVEGASLRYKSIFNFVNSANASSILILGSYLVNDTKYILESVGQLNNNLIFKNHPAVNKKYFTKIIKNVKITDDNIYKLFKNSNFVISSASGTLIEAVSCGLSAIIVASQTNLTANPFSNYGKGEIWDIAFSKDDVILVYNKLLKYRLENISRINEIAVWYKSNYFIEPTEENIIKAFEI